MPNEEIKSNDPIVQELLNEQKQRLGAIDINKEKINKGIDEYEDIEHRAKKAQGGVKIYRSIMKSNLWENSTLLQVFLYCLLRANWEDKEVVIGFKKIFLKRGQFIASTQNIAKDCLLTRQNIRTCINALKSTNNLTTKPTNRFLLITVLNYDKWQGNQPTNQPTKRKPANQQLTTDNNFNNFNKKYYRNFDFLDADLKNGFLELPSFFEKYFGSSSRIENVLGFYLALEYKKESENEVRGKFLNLKNENTRALYEILKLSNREIYIIMANLKRNNKLSITACYNAIKFKTKNNKQELNKITDELSKKLSIPF